MKTIALLVLLAGPAAAFSLWGGKKGDGLPSVGRAAPEFALDSQAGTPVSLKDLRGKWVVLYFYPKDFTHGCTIEAHEFQAAAPKFEKKDAIILGVSVQDAASHKDFCAKEGLGFKLLADVDMKVSKMYGSLSNYGVAKLSTRNTFLIGPDGVLRKEWVKVEPSKHVDEVLAALDDLQKAAK
jgi:peroxiredoxin Q/BCP